ncbi:hypothetical protein FALBO_11456 [Fusarium albosuccineum]|uniref:Uncharacterized protein n=1 Tax=Fusarium albosuccineum TaxID=1237068 RepID=A0A8H4L2H7_9HYPO|nr:hypothetical protein FALBO_11456 [Fusarium albosuccineum]
MALRGPSPDPCPRPRMGHMSLVITTQIYLQLTDGFIGDFFTTATETRQGDAGARSIPVIIPGVLEMSLRVNGGYLKEEEKSSPCKCQDPEMQGTHHGIAAAQQAVAQCEEHMKNIGSDRLRYAIAASQSSG